jgi:hypothetical protein
MTRVVVIIGSETTPAQAGRLSRSARAAVALAQSRFDSRFDARTLRPDDAASRYALAAGARSSEAWSSEQLAEHVRDVALLGGDLGEGDLCAARLAEAWQGALIFDVLDVERDGSRLRVIRDCGRGAREILSVTGPTVLVISPESQARFYVSRHKLQNVRNASSSNGSPADDSTSKWQPAQPRAKTSNLAAKNRAVAVDRMLEAFGIGGGESAAESSRQVIDADPRTCAEHLLRYLAHHGLLDRTRISLDLLHEQTETAPSHHVSKAALETVSSRGSTDSSARNRRGPRDIDAKSSGMHRRPREISANSAAQSPPDQVARRPRNLTGDNSRNLRGPITIATSNISEQTTTLSKNK